MASRNPILHNAGLKLISLLLAALLWLGIKAIILPRESSPPVVTTVNSRVFTNVPVSLLFSPYNTNRFQIIPPTVMVQLDGDKDALESLNPDKITASLDLTRFDTNRIFSQEVLISAPREYKVAAVKPSWITVERLTAPQTNRVPTLAP